MRTEDYISRIPYTSKQLLQEKSKSRCVNSQISIEEIPRVEVLGLKIAAISSAQLNAVVGRCVELGQKRQILHVNVHGFNLCFRHAWMYAYLSRADLLFCDGAGVRVGALLLGRMLPKRITLADWIWEFAAYAEPRGYTMFFLGALPGVAQQAAHALKDHHPNLKIVGVHHGFFDREAESSENQRVVELINSAKPDVLWVGLGMPLQEEWLRNNWSRLDVKVAINSGAMLDYVAGTVPRAPRWLTDHGMEWLGRLLIEPRRLWRRYLIGNPLFLWRIFTHMVKK